MSSSGGIARMLRRVARVLPFLALLFLPFVNDWRASAIIGTVLLTYLAIFVGEIDVARTAAKRDRRLRELVRSEFARLRAEFQNEAARQASKSDRTQDTMNECAEQLREQARVLDSVSEIATMLAEQSNMREEALNLRRALIAQKFLRHFDEEDEIR